MYIVHLQVVEVERGQIPRLAVQRPGACREIRHCLIHDGTFLIAVVGETGVEGSLKVIIWVR
jgi:hypothetical protein